MARCVSLLVLASLASCTPEREGAPAGPRDDDAPPLLTDAGTDAPPPVCEPPLADRSRLVRLTARQSANSVHALLGVRVDATGVTRFAADPERNGLDNAADALVVGPQHARDYQRAGEALADVALADRADFEARFGCGDLACAEALVESLGAQAFRRPLEATTHARYLHLFEDAAIGEDPFRAAATQLVAAMLQSPHFLYRLERSATPDGSGDVPLDGYEVASRLSYLLWNSMPDAALFAAAEADALRTQEDVDAQVDRMLADPRVADVLDDFHAQWLDTDAWGELLRAERLAPGIDAAMREETRSFIAAETTAGRGLRALLTSRRTFINADRAALYGGEAPAAEGFGPALLDPEERAGVLTHAGFLAHFRAFADPSPIRRGVHLHRRILCTERDPPPGDAELELPPPSPEARTNRERVEAHTASEGCQRCHAEINPVGFAFESFDAVGRWRDTDNGEPVDTAVRVPFRAARDIEVDGPVAMSEALAERPEAHRCYATWWLRYARGRAETREESCALDALGAASQNEDLGALGLLETLAKSRDVRFRAAEDGEDTP